MGSKTLAMRIEKGPGERLRLALWLAGDPRVAWVNYPGLSSHPQRALARAQMKGFGTMLAFGLRGGFDAAGSG